MQTTAFKTKVMPNRYLKGYFTLVGRKIANTQFIRWSGRQVYGIWSVNAAETSNFQKKNLTDLLTVDECLAKKNLLQAILKTIPISGTPFIGFNDLDISKCYYCTV